MTKIRGLNYSHVLHSWMPESGCLFHQCQQTPINCPVLAQYIKSSFIMSLIQPRIFVLLIATCWPANSCNHDAAIVACCFLSDGVSSQILGWCLPTSLLKDLCHPSRSLFVLPSSWWIFTFWLGIVWRSMYLLKEIQHIHKDKNGKYKWWFWQKLSFLYLKQMT